MVQLVWMDLINISEKERERGMETDDHSLWVKMVSGYKCPQINFI